MQALTDFFFVSIGKSTSCSTSKRSIVSDIARTFEVLGLVSTLHCDDEDSVPETMETTSQLG